jgi:hypothetical protein
MAFKTPKGTVAFPVLANPKAPKGSNNPENLQYSVVLLFTEEATKTPEFTALKKAVVDTCVEALGRDKAALLIKDNKIKLGIRYDVESSGFPPEYKCFVRMKSKNKPGMVDRFADPKTGKPIPITDPSDLYAGSEARALVSLKYWDVDGGKAVTWYLNHIQKTGEGDRIDGRVAAEDAFEALEESNEVDIASLSTSKSTPASVQSDEDELAALLGGVGNKN